MRKDSIEKLAPEQGVALAWWGTILSIQYRGKEYQVGNWISLHRWTKKKWEEKFSSIATQAASLETLP